MFGDGLGHGLAGDANRGRLVLVRDSTQALLDCLRKTADVALHASHRNGDQPNPHPHILTTTGMPTAGAN